MKAFQHALLFLLSSVFTSADLMMGDQVCMTGFIMDTFCIERGTLLDNSAVTTLKNPELHSYHCLLDVGVCINSGYQVLGNKDPISGLYCPGLRIDVDETDRVLAAGRAHGTTESDPDFFKCDTCTGPDGNPIAGYRATIVGTVKELGDGMGRVTGVPGTRSVVGTPVLTNVQVLDSTVSCDPNTMVSVEADVLGNECLIRSAAAAEAVAVGDANGTVVSTPSVVDDTSTTLEPPPAETTTTAPPVINPPVLKIGDEICTTGFIMDTLCIGRGTLLDAPSVATLKNPELHSYHCLLDVDICIDSGFQVLGEKDPNTGDHCLGYRLEETDKVLAAGRAHGSTKSDPNFFSCDSCTGPDNNPIAGYRATVKGTIKELGDGSQSVSGQPLLTNIQMLDASVECATPAPQTVCLGSPDGATPVPGTPSAGEKAPSADADCSSVFCKMTLTDGYTLRYKLNEPEGTVSMEATYAGQAWLGIAFSEDEKMGGSNGILGSPDSGIPQKYRLNQGFIEVMPSEEQTLTDASVVVDENGQTVMKFTKPLVEANQIPITPGVNKMLWANGGDSTTIGYHGTNKAPFSLNLNFSGSLALETPPPVESPVLKIGDEICTTGFIMDTLCIGRGTLLDAPSVATLKNPELHSYHCLLDVDICIDSGFQVLGEKDPNTGDHCLGYRLEETDKVLAAGRAHGSTKSDPNFFSCDSCTGPDNNPIAGYRATVKGTIKELGDGSQSVSGQPLLTNIQMLDASMECATPAPQTVCLGSPDGATPVPGTPSAGEKAPSADADCSRVFCKTTLTDGYTLRYKLNEPEGTVSMEATYAGQAWLGIAFSEDEKMGGSNGILGSPDSGIPQKYRLNQGFIEVMPSEEQTLTDASVVVDENGQTVMKFTKPLVEPNQIPIIAGDNKMLWAHGGDSTVIGYHGQNRAPVKINLSSGAAETVRAPNMGAWLAHGICAFIAWGMLAPTAVNAAIYRSLFKGPFWFKLHQFFNGSAYALTIIAFAIAVAFISKEGNPHWFSSHAKMGLSMFIIASVHVLWGAARPHLPDPDSGDEKTTIRKVWEIKHRLTGTILLACGFWQMSAGIKLFAIKYSGVGSVEEQGVTIAYWIWIGAEVALLLIGGVYFRLLKKPAEDDGGNDATNAVDDKQKEDAVEESV